MRSLGEFVGHIWKGVKTDPSRTEVGRQVEESNDGNITYRRTTIDEVIVKPSTDDPGPAPRPKNTDHG